MALKDVLDKSFIGSNFSFVTQVLKGLGQIMLQENTITGLLFLIGIFYGSVTTGLAALSASVCGTATARLFKYDKTETEKGLYGFSAPLVGVALILLFKPVFITWILIIIGSVLATVIQHFFISRNIPVFTLPFVLVTWAMVFLVNYFYPDIVANASVLPASVSHHFTFAISGFGQVIFQDNVFSGTLFFIGVLVSSPVAALYGLAGAILSGILSLHFSAPIEDVGIGIFSFNAVLCAIVFSGSQLKDSIWVLVSVILSLVISITILQYDLPQLTFPFVAASCVTLLLKKKLQKR